MAEIREANMSEFKKIMGFYYALIDRMAELPFNHIWKKDVYPHPDFVKQLIENREFFVMTQDSEIIAVMALNHILEGYDDMTWKVNAEQDQVLVIHAIAVAPTHMGKGYSKEMLRFAIAKARESGMKTIRLDVLPKNIPAVNAYISTGFQYVDTRTMHYGDSGDMSFDIYELPL